MPIFIANNSLTIHTDYYGGGGISSGVGVSASRGKAHSVFGTALTRLTIVLSIATICFVIRISMLILKMAAFHSNTTISTPSAPLFGFVWFCASDFIPRCLPSFAFVYLMRGRRRSGGGRRGEYTSTNRMGGFAARRAAGGLDPYSGGGRIMGDGDNSVDVSVCACNVYCNRHIYMGIHVMQSY